MQSWATGQLQCFSFAWCRRVIWYHPEDNNGEEETDGNKMDNCIIDTCSSTFVMLTRVHSIKLKHARKWCQDPLPCGSCAVFFKVFVQCCLPTLYNWMRNRLLNCCCLIKKDWLQPQQLFWYIVKGRPPQYHLIIIRLATYTAKVSTYQGTIWM